jgi:serine/threonine protein kinase
LRILDLGLALLSTGEAQSEHLTLSGQVMGTADYMAPEQWEASHAVDIRADIYSLGCTLHTLLTGHAPFAGPQHNSALRKMAAHAKEPPRPMTESREVIPAELQALYERLVAKLPEDRPATPAAVAALLKPFCIGADLPTLACEALAKKDIPAAEIGTNGGGLTLSGQPKATPPLSQPEGKRRRRTLWPVLALAPLAVVVAIVALIRPPDPDKTKSPEPPQAKRGGWKNLLKAEPGKRLWVPKLDARFAHDSEKELLWVQSAHPALIRLGETDAPSYILQIGFRQVPWTGGAGVYFAGKNGKEFRFQLISLVESHPTDPTPFLLQRSTAYVWSEPGFDPSVPLFSFASSDHLRRPGNQEQLFEMEVNNQGLYHVRWNVVPCPELCGKTNFKAEWKDDYRGEFGVYCIGSNVTISKARILELE